MSGSTIGTVVTLDNDSDDIHAVIFEATATYDIDYGRLQRLEPFNLYMMPGTISQYRDIYKIVDSGSMPALPIGLDEPMGPGSTFAFRMFATNHTDEWMYEVDGHVVGLSADDKVWIDGGPVDIAPHSEAEFWFHIEVSETAVEASRTMKIVFTKKL